MYKMTCDSKINLFRFMQVKLANISYIRNLFIKVQFIQDFGLFRVQFIQDFGLFRVRFKQVSLYNIFKFTTFVTLHKNNEIELYKKVGC